jgi:hypothetical protein
MKACISAPKLQLEMQDENGVFVFTFSLNIVLANAKALKNDGIITDTKLETICGQLHNESLLVWLSQRYPSLKEYR